MASPSRKMALFLAMVLVCSVFTKAIQYDDEEDRFRARVGSPSHKQAEKQRDITLDDPPFSIDGDGDGDDVENQPRVALGDTLEPEIIVRVHFWAPTFKWGLIVANVADYSKPEDEISYPQQAAMVITGAIWARYSTVVTPKNWPLFSVSIGMATTGAYQLLRKYKYDCTSKKEIVLGNER